MLSTAHRRGNRVAPERPHVLPGAHPVTKHLIAATLFLAACGSKSEPSKSKPTDQAPPVTAPAVAAKPEIGAWGFDTAGMKPDVAPGASFYQHANGTWLEKTPIPADKSNYGMFSVLADRSEARTKEIILGAATASGPEAKKVADYYQSFMDEAAIEAAGITPIQPQLDRIAAITDAAGLLAEFGDNARHFRKAPFATIVGQDDKDPEHYIASLAQGGLGLPDRDFYEPKAAQFAAVRDGYKQYLETLLTLIGAKDAAKRAAAVYALEEKIAATHWTRVQNRDPQKTYNKMTLAELQQLAPGVDWAAWAASVGLADVPAINVNQPSAIAGIAKLVGSEPLAVWRDYLTVTLVSGAASGLSKAFVDARFAMYGKVLSGTPENKERWKRGVDEVTGALGEAVGKLYVEKYFTPATKARADELVKNLLVAMGQRLDALTWMSAETKAKAKAKLASYNPKIGYPKVWRDYSKLEVKAGDPVGNDERASAFEYDRRLARLGQPIDRDEWGMTPMTVNAYYNPGLNEIVFPAAILQPPFFDANADDAVNYGGIGAVIGHEISHGFDDQGAQYDAKGALANWWTADDTAKFKVATNQLVAQYGTYCPVAAVDGKPAQCVNGELTLGENIADLAGLTVAYSAYQLALGGKPAPVLDGLTGDQRFFLGWAQVWRRLYRDQELANRLVTDPHSPSEFRTSVVRNLDAWYEAYKPAATDALFLAPDARVRIW
ncbi:MAG: M13 family metallopeptidase [Myxococcales bacterium]|nr:M13 family metallopeptidase [Myxococcales bacterium]